MVQCYIDDCDFTTPDVEDATGATVLDHHLARVLRTRLLEMVNKDTLDTINEADLLKLIKKSAVLMVAKLYTMPNFMRSNNNKVSHFRGLSHA